MRKRNFRLTISQLVSSMFFVVLTSYAGICHAESIVYDEIIFAPVSISDFEGRKFLDVEDMSGNMWSYTFMDYSKLESEINVAINEKKALAFYLQLGEIVHVSEFTREVVYVYPFYSETKNYYALNFSFVEAEARLKLKVTKEDNPLSYKISEQFLTSFGDIVDVYFFDGELLEIYPNQ